MPGHWHTLEAVRGFKERGTGDGVVRRAADPGAAPGRRTLTEDISPGPGAPVDGALRERAEHSLGVPLDHARVHADAGSARAAKAIGARAFTYGASIHLGAGESASDTRLMAHELTHVAQQGDAPVTQTKLEVGSVSDPAEHEADRAADHVVAGTPFLGFLPGGHGVSPLRRTPSAATSGTDLIANADEPDAAEQSAIAGYLNPGGPPGTPFVKKGFVKQMTKALDKWRANQHTTAANSQSKTKGVHLDMPQVRETGKAAQKVVTDKFGSLVKAAVPDPGTPASDPAYDASDPSVLHPQTDTMDGLGKADKRDVRRDLVTYAMQDADGGGDVWNKHHASEAEPTVVKLRNEYANTYMTQLTLIQRMWPGEEHPWDGTVYVGTNLERDKGLSKKEKADPDYKDANKRKGYWGSFQTLIHEYLHACAHANFMAKAGSGMQDRILTEGGCDYFTEQVWTDLEPKLPGAAMDPLRVQIEGASYPFKADILPAMVYYDQEKEVIKTKIVPELSKRGGDGDAAFRAAYFLGHVEYLGLGPSWSAADAADKGKFTVPAGVTKLKGAASMTCIGEAALAAANGLAVGDAVMVGQVLTAPGVSYHHVLDGESDANVATQHGVTVASLKAANPDPGITWASLKAPLKLLIPNH
jgi:hypothetical protein